MNSYARLDSRLNERPPEARSEDDSCQTVSQRLDTHMEGALESVRRWDTALTPAQSAAVASGHVRRALMLRSFVDGYWRIRRTEPMIELAIDTFERRGDRRSAAFWRAHVAEEAGHDHVMLADIERIVGGPAARDAVLEGCPITPPSAALVGYFEWQVRHNDPHLLIVLRYFLETFFARIDDAAATAVHEQVNGGSATLALHREADADHVEPCREYIDRSFTRAAIPSLLWSVDFVALSLRRSQSWAASAVLGELES